MINNEWINNESWLFSIKWLNWKKSFQENWNSMNSKDTRVSWFYQTSVGKVPVYTFFTVQHLSIFRTGKSIKQFGPDRGMWRTRMSGDSVFSSCWYRPYWSSWLWYRKELSRTRFCIRVSRKTLTTLLDMYLDFIEPIHFQLRI